MVMTETFLKCMASVIAVGISAVLSYFCFVWSRNWQLRHGYVDDMYAPFRGYGLAFFGIFIAVMYYIVGKFLLDATTTAVLIGASAVGAAATALLTGRRYTRHDAIAATGLMLAYTPPMCIGVTALAIWMVPDVTTVYENAPRNYHCSKTYGWIPGEGMKATGSYLENQTSDTLYRVTVTYAIPGEDLDNLYAVTDTFPPSAFGGMNSRADYYMHEIPPFMRWSTGKAGRYRTQRVFVVNRQMLSEFINRYDMSVFGLRPHRRVKTLKESSNRIVSEDPSNLTEYKRIIKAENSRKSH